jgi:hypothetical protein
MMATVIASQLYPAAERAGSPVIPRFSNSSCGEARRISGHTARVFVFRAKCASCADIITRIDPAAREAEISAVPPEILRAPPQDELQDVANPNSCNTLTFASIIT